MSQLIFCTFYPVICFSIFAARTLLINLKLVFFPVCGFFLECYVQTTKGKIILAIHLSKKIGM